MNVFRPVRAVQRGTPFMGDVRNPSVEGQWSPMAMSEASERLLDDSH